MTEDGDFLIAAKEISVGDKSGVDERGIAVDIAMQFKLPELLESGGTLFLLFKLFVGGPMATPKPSYPKWGTSGLVGVCANEDCEKISGFLAEEPRC